MHSLIPQQLKAAREQRGLTLADVEHETRIPQARLRLLEEGNYAGFGSMTYARSFLRAYGNFLGVDAETVASTLPQQVLGGRGDYRHLTDNLGPWVSNNQRRTRHAPMHQDAPQVPHTGLYALAIFVTIGLCAMILGMRFLTPKSVPVGFGKLHDLSVQPPALSEAEKIGPKLVSMHTGSMPVSAAPSTELPVRRAEPVDASDDATDSGL